MMVCAVKRGMFFEDAESFEELFGEGVVNALDEMLEGDVDRAAQLSVPAEHTPGGGAVLKAGTVGPRVDGTTSVAKIAIVAPAAFSPTASTDGSAKTIKARFKTRGHTVSLDQAPGAPFAASTVHPSGAYRLAGTDANRWAAIKWGMFDPATTAMICVRGGYGVMRLLWRMYMFVNYDPAQAWKTPKRIVGYSDATALLLASYSLMRWASVHGPMLVDSGKGNETLDSLIDVLTKHPKDLYPGNLVSNTLTVAGKIPDQRVKGVLLGGNLSLVEAMYGSVFLPSLKGAILLLEETNEPEYRVDRLLEALTLRGINEDIRGVVLGNFTDLSAKRTAELIVSSWSLPASRSGGGRRPMPCAYGLKSGHMTPNLALWIGLEHELVIKDKGTKAELYLVP
jgi:muramoyltetrapeptide carboxypeptidase